VLLTPEFANGHQIMSFLSSYPRRTPSGPEVKKRMMNYSKLLNTRVSNDFISQMVLMPWKVNFEGLGNTGMWPVVL
jgi:hypothetical protein